jgi:hypothetical protein
MTEEISNEESKTLDLIKQKTNINLDNNNDENKSALNETTFNKLVG